MTANILAYTIKLAFVIAGWNIRGVAKSLLHSFAVWDFVHIDREAKILCIIFACWACAFDFYGQLSPSHLFQIGVL